MKRPFDPDDHSAQAKAALQVHAAGKASPKPKAVPVPCQVPKPLPADPVRGSTSSAVLVKNVQGGQPNVCFVGKFIISTEAGSCVASIAQAPL